MLPDDHVVRRHAGWHPTAAGDAGADRDDPVPLANGARADGCSGGCTSRRPDRAGTCAAARRRRRTEPARRRPRRRLLQFAIVRASTPTPRAARRSPPPSWRPPWTRSAQSAGLAGASGPGPPGPSALRRPPAGAARCMSGEPFIASQTCSTDRRPERRPPAKRHGPRRA
ncbi:hypothetical protein HBB16_08620 [Pseudonocardia sp. MCCB 268]|nr:hypothetical protein [Pseudonocardia cytotoxica]